MVTRLDRASRSTRDFLNTLAMIAILHSYGWSSSCFIAIKVKGEIDRQGNGQGGGTAHGDSQARRNATPGNNRFHRIFEELAALGIHAEPAVYADDIACEVREQLLKVDGVLVSVDPIHQGQTRTVLDAMLPGCGFARSLGQRAPRRDPQDGRKGGRPPPHEASRLGHRYPSLSHRGERYLNSPIRAPAREGP